MLTALESDEPMPEVDPSVLWKCPLQGCAFKVPYEGQTASVLYEIIGLHRDEHVKSSFAAPGDAAAAYEDFWLKGPDGEPVEDIPGMD